jgi:Mrp family chromosome partitioning ATPase
LPFQPVWEVDAFGLPECVQRLDTEARLVMKEAGVALRRASADGLRVLAITSPGRGHGRTTVAIQLARAAAQYGLSVALVDADTDRPALADRLCVEVSRGWIDAAGDGLPLEEVAIYSISDGITLLPLIPWNEGSSKLREKGTVIQSVFEHLSRDHDLVVVDCGHIASLGMLFNDPTHQPVDAALLVCDQRMNNAEARDAGVARLQRLGIQQVGIIENFVARQN